MSILRFRWSFEILLGGVDAHRILTDIAADTRFESECDRCEALAGQTPGTFPNYQSLPQECIKFFSASGALACAVER